MQSAVVVRELSDKDVLSIDPIVEYEIRRYMRALAQQWLDKTDDESNAIVQLGRPTGP